MLRLRVANERKGGSRRQRLNAIVDGHMKGMTMARGGGRMMGWRR